jgi:hypothetical protein
MPITLGFLIFDAVGVTTIRRLCRHGRDRRDRGQHENAI